MGRRQRKERRRCWSLKGTTRYRPLQSTRADAQRRNATARGVRTLGAAVFEGAASASFRRPGAWGLNRLWKETTVPEDQGAESGAVEPMQPCPAPAGGLSSAVLCRCTVGHHVAFPGRSFPHQGPPVWQTGPRGITACMCTAQAACSRLLPGILDLRSWPALHAVGGCAGAHLLRVNDARFVSFRIVSILNTDTLQRRLVPLLLAWVLLSASHSARSEAANIKLRTN